MATGPTQSSQQQPSRLTRFFGKNWKVGAVTSILTTLVLGTITVLFQDYLYGLRHRAKLSIEITEISREMSDEENIALSGFKEFEFLSKEYAAEIFKVDRGPLTKPIPSPNPDAEPDGTEGKSDLVSLVRLNLVVETAKREREALQRSSTSNDPKKRLPKDQSCLSWSRRSAPPMKRFTIYYARTRNSRSPRRSQTRETPTFP